MELLFPSVHVDSSLLYHLSLLYFSHNCYLAWWGVAFMHFSICLLAHCKVICWGQGLCFAHCWSLWLSLAPPYPRLLVEWISVGWVNEIFFVSLLESQSLKHLAVSLLPWLGSLWKFPPFTFNLSLFLWGGQGISILQIKSNLGLVWSLLYSLNWITTGLRYIKMRIFIQT